MLWLETTVLKQPLLLDLVSMRAHFVTPGDVASSKLSSMHASTKQSP